MAAYPIIDIVATDRLKLHDLAHHSPVVLALHQSSLDMRSGFVVVSISRNTLLRISTGHSSLSNASFCSFCSAALIFADQVSIGRNGDWSARFRVCHSL